MGEKTTEARLGGYPKPSKTKAVIGLLLGLMIIAGALYGFGSLLVWVWSCL